MLRRQAFLCLNQVLELIFVHVKWTFYPTPKFLGKILRQVFHGLTWRHNIGSLLECYISFSLAYFLFKEPL